MIPADAMRHLGPASIIRGDARALPVADHSVDLIVTSPPYFAFRRYRDGGEHDAGQVGSELTPEEYLDALLDCTREMLRVLKPRGSMWINLGDKYNSAASGQQNRTASTSLTGGRHDRMFGRGTAVGTARMKSLLGLPWRYALGCIDDLGLILRAEVIWSKPNGLPESVTDRVRRSHEQWFHFVTQPAYFSAVDEIREAHTSDMHGARRGSRTSKRGEAEEHDRRIETDYRNGRDHDARTPLGRVPGSVWSVASEPLRVPPELDFAHCAAFPSEWPRRLILGWSPTGICVECGEGRRPGTHKKPMQWREPPAFAARHAPNATRKAVSGTMLAPAETKSTGYACACPEPKAATSPARILDPFGGSGTTAMVARALDRHGITVDLSADYCRLARWRCCDLNQLAAVQGRDRTTKRGRDEEPNLLDLLTAGAHRPSSPPRS